MSLTIRDLETERLALEVAELTGDNKTAAVRQSLRRERERLRRERGLGLDDPTACPLAGSWMLVRIPETGSHR